MGFHSIMSHCMSSMVSSYITTWLSACGTNHYSLLLIRAILLDWKVIKRHQQLMQIPTALFYNWVHNHHSRQFCAGHLIFILLKYTSSDIWKNIWHIFSAKEQGLRTNSAGDDKGKCIKFIFLLLSFAVTNLFALNWCSWK